MTRRGLFLADGPSDLPLADHLPGLCAAHGIVLDVVAVNSDRLPTNDHTVAGRLASVLAQDQAFDCAFVHRDAEAQKPELRHQEVRDGATQAGFNRPIVAVVPIRMTEAWLLLDEQAIREVASRPNGRNQLHLPTPHEVERIANPKARLAETLVAAADVSGRRLKTFQRRFGEHRRQLIQRLDLEGPVATLQAWAQLNQDLADLAKILR